MYKSIVEGKGGISAKVVCDSTANRVRITTMELRYHRYIHSEFLTHRMFSRNASSSRAIPVAKTLDQVQNNPAKPIHWGKNQPGMQAYETISNISNAVNAWLGASYTAASHAKNLVHHKVHKQIVNRLLEPFQFIRVVVTATEWSNFFALRDHPAAQPEIQELARCMKQAMEESEPDELQPGEWHLPYVTPVRDPKAVDYDIEKLIKLSVARCARVSYLNHDKTSSSIEDDLELYNMLVTRPYTDKRGNVLSADDPIHASPAEHQATPMSVKSSDGWALPHAIYEPGKTHIDVNGNHWSGNFRGWIQYRQTL